LLEIADVFVINKADRPGVQEARRDLEHMLDMAGLLTDGHGGSTGWRPPIIPSVAARGEGTDDVWAAIEDHRASLEKSGELDRRRERRMIEELRAIVVERLLDRARQAGRGERFDDLRQRMLDRDVDPYAAAEEILGWLE
jgi:LAO/AO transport system kinase